MHAQYWGDHSNCQKTINLLKLLDMASVSSVLYYRLYKNLERNLALKCNLFCQILNKWVYEGNSSEWPVSGHLRAF